MLSLCLFNRKNVYLIIKRRNAKCWDLTPLLQFIYVIAINSLPAFFTFHLLASLLIFPHLFECINQLICWGIVRGSTVVMAEFRKDFVGELFPEFNAPLVEAEYIPYHTLNKYFMLIQRDQATERPRGYFF